MATRNAIPAKRSSGGTPSQPFKADATRKVAPRAAGTPGRAIKASGPKPTPQPQKKSAIEPGAKGAMFYARKDARAQSLTAQRSTAVRRNGSASASSPAVKAPGYQGRMGGPAVPVASGKSSPAIRRTTSSMENSSVPGGREMVSRPSAGTPNQRAGTRGQVKPSGIDLPKFAGQVSQNFASGIGAAAQAAQRVKVPGFPTIAPSGSLSGAYGTGTDNQNNPLKKQLGR